MVPCVAKRMHDGNVAVDSEEKRVGHRDRGEQQLEGPRVRVHVVVDSGVVDLPAEVGHQRRADDPDAEIWKNSYSTYPS